jgi:hypothetical protein
MTSGLRPQITKETFEKIDQLLGSSINLDQVAILKSEAFSINDNGSPEYAEVPCKVAHCATENARKIKEVRKLLVSIVIRND